MDSGLKDRWIYRKIDSMPTDGNPIRKTDRNSL